MKTAIGWICVGIGIFLLLLCAGQNKKTFTDLVVVASVFILVGCFLLGFLGGFSTTN